MATHTETPDREADEQAGQRDRNTVQRATQAFKKSGRNGWLALGVGGLLLVRALRGATKGRWGRAFLRGITGAMLVAIGRRQRRSTTGESGLDHGHTAGSSEERDGAVSDDVGPETEADTGSAVSPDPDVGQSEGDEAGRVTFTDEQDDEPRSEPNLDEGATDPRRKHDEGNEAVEIDISDAHLADEASEATGPSPEQAQPAQTEGTELEPTPEEDASNMDRDAEETGGGTFEEEASEEGKASKDARAEDDETGAAGADEESSDES